MQNHNIFQNHSLSIQGAFSSSPESRLADCSLNSKLESQRLEDCLPVCIRTDFTASIQQAFIAVSLSKVIFPDEPVPYPLPPLPRFQPLPAVSCQKFYNHYGPNRFPANVSRTYGFKAGEAASGRTAPGFPDCRLLFVPEYTAQPLQRFAHDCLPLIPGGFNKPRFLIKAQGALIIKNVPLIRKLRVSFNGSISL